MQKFLLDPLWIIEENEEARTAPWRHASSKQAVPGGNARGSEQLNITKNLKQKGR